MLLNLFLRSREWRSGRWRATQSRRSRRSFVPQLTVLEERTVPSTFTVTNLADSGSGSLRDAVQQANLSPGADTIQFAPRLTGTIALASEIQITSDLTIDGTNANQLTVSARNATLDFDV